MIRACHGLNDTAFRPFSAPEIDLREYGKEVDVFAAGLTLYVAVAGFPMEVSHIW